MEAHCGWKLLGLKPTSIPPPAPYPPFAMPLGKGLEKMGKRPQRQAPTELAGSSASVCANSHREQLLPTPTRTPELTRRTLKLTKAPSAVCGG